MNEASFLRLIWSVIEEIPTSDLLNLNDTALVRMLLQQVSSRNCLSGDEVCALHDYVGSRTSLIRDIAESRRRF